MKLNYRIDHFASPTDSLPDAILKVLDKANADLWWHRLVLEALTLAPADSRLQEFAEFDTGTSVATNGSRHQNPSDAATEPIDNLHLAPSASLIGRDESCRQLQALLDNRANSDWLPVVVHGEPGVGKSSLISYVSKKARASYAIRWWTGAETELQIRTSMRTLARELGAAWEIASPTSDATDPQSEIRFMEDLRREIKIRIQELPALLILDNVDDSSLKRRLPSVLRHLRMPNVCVLITSQSASWADMAEPMHLSGLNHSEGPKLVAHISRRKDLEIDPAVGEISNHFGGRPLFLRLIGSMLSDGDSPSRYLEVLRDSTIAALDTLPESDGFEPLATQVYSMAIDRAEATSLGARALLEACAFCAPEPIPASLTTQIGASFGWPNSTTTRVLRTLDDRSLIQRTYESNDHEASVTVHRVVAALVRLEAERELRSADRIAAAAEAVERVIPDEIAIRTGVSLASMAEVASHIEELARNVSAVQISARHLSAAASSMAALALFRRTSSEWQAAQDAHMMAVGLFERAADTRRGAVQQVRLANVMRQRGDFLSAESTLVPALIVLKEAMPDDLDYAWALTVQARVLRARANSDTEGARLLLDHAFDVLARYQSKGSTVHRIQAMRQISELHGYRSVLLRQVGLYDLAEREARAGLTLITGGRGVDELLATSDAPAEPLIATHLRALGGVWRLRGAFEEAIAAQKLAIDIFKRVYGADHTDVGRGYDSLGRSQREWGDLAGAQGSFEESLRISNLRFGDDYPHAGTANVNLGLVAFDWANFDEAETRALEAVRIYSQAYGESPQDVAQGHFVNEATAWAEFLRACAIAGKGDTGGAIALHSRVLTWREERNPAHPHVATSHYWLGEALAMDGRHSDALRHHESALEIRRQAFRSDANYWVALSLGKVGELLRSEELIVSALNSAEAQLAPNHPRVRHLRHVLQVIAAGDAI